ncbi:MAG: OmpP1/FadL family transporter [Candidatus Berkiellales bacterium]
MTRKWDLSIQKSILTKFSSSLVMCCLASKAFASGFALQEQSVTLLGTAYSGTAALAEDASTGYYNPAGLTRIIDSQIVLSAILIQGDFKLTADSATNSFRFPMGGGTARPGKVSLVPTFHLAKRIDDRWVLGFNVTTPFGLATRYKEDSIARYLATNSDIATIDLSPSIAYQILPSFSLGFGVDAQYADATLSADFSGFDNQIIHDGYQRNHASGWGYGLHFGALWEPLETTRVGLAYRSLVNLHVEGNSENQTQLGYVPVRVHTDITVPESATLSLYQELNRCLALTGDIAWTNWSRFHTLRLRYNRIINITNPFNGAPAIAPDIDTFEHFKDTRRFALGLIYTMDDTWRFRGGVAYDQSPVRNEFRTLRLPDSDRYWLAVGGAYAVNDSFNIDFGYAHLFFKDSSIHEHAPFIAQTQTPVTAATLDGKFKSSANLVGIQIRYDFV